MIRATPRARHLLPFLLAAAASGQTAQNPLELTPEVMPATLRHAGTYHVVSGTWTRNGGQTAAFGPDVIYSNTALSGYFSSAGGAGGFAPGSENFDEGGIPGTTSGHTFSGTPNRDEYFVNCLSIGYCDLGAPGSSGFEIQFFESYTPCTFDQSPDDSLSVAGLPAAGGCWTVDLDLSGGAEICLVADGTGVWNNDPNLDSFGWSWRYSGTDGAPGNSVGFVLAGNPSVTDPTYNSGGVPIDGSNTYYGSTLCPGVGTGYMARDFWWLADPTGVNTNCYFFGGYSNNNGSCTGPSNPWTSYYFEMAADTGTCTACGGGICGPVYCNSNPNSTGVVTRIELGGSIVAADDNFVLRASDLPLQAFGFFITSETQGFVANPNGSQGNLCVLGNIGRFVGAGQIKNSGATGEITLDTNAGEWSLTAIPSSTGPYAAVAGLTSNFQLWHRDVVGGSTTSNFSDGATITWL